MTLLCIVGFENNLAQMIIMTRQCVANKNHVARSEVTVHTQTLCVGFSETCSCPTHNLIMYGGIINNFSILRQCDAYIGIGGHSPADDDSNFHMPG